MLKSLKWRKVAFENDIFIFTSSRKCKHTQLTFLRSISFQKIAFILKDFQTLNNMAKNISTLGLEEFSYFMVTNFNEKWMFC